MDIPGQVSGIPVTPRGVHLLPFGFHDQWMEKVDYWTNLLRSMGMSWVVAKSASDAFYKSGAAEALIKNGVLFVVRFDYKFPNPWTEADATEQLVNLCARYNAPCVIQFANEPFDEREWVNKEVPPKPEAWAIIRDRWHQMADQTVRRGAYPGFPDGPSYDENPFNIIGDEDLHWQEGRAVYLCHSYGKGRPLNYPMDDVSRNGTPLTMEQYLAALDDYASDPDWNEGPEVLGMMNEQRREWADPDKTAIEDDVCWQGWKRTLDYSRKAFGFEVQMGMTEGGWTPRDRAGSNPTDIRWPYTTPNMVADKTLAMYDDPESPHFAICPWLLGSESMGGSGWPFDAWTGWAYSDKYGFEKPVVKKLQDNPPLPDAGDEWDAVLTAWKELRNLTARCC